jgi:hypothetical protein
MTSWHLSWLIALVVLAVGSTVAMGACTDPYLAAQTACEQHNSTRAAIDACRNAVKADAGRLDAEVGQ